MVDTQITGQSNMSTTSAAWLAPLDAVAAAAATEDVVVLHLDAFIAKNSAIKGNKITFD